MRDLHVAGVVSLHDAEEDVMLRIGSIVWGVCDVPTAIRFRCAALDYQPLREPSSDWAILVPRVGTGVQLAISQVSSQAQDHQRHHLGLYAQDKAAEIARPVRSAKRASARVTSVTGSPPLRHRGVTRAPHFSVRTDGAATC
jgi:hypothetical protein